MRWKTRAYFRLLRSRASSFRLACQLLFASRHDAIGWIRSDECSMRPICCSSIQTTGWSLLAIVRQPPKSGKSIMLRELCSLARPGRCLIVYHHQSRRPGGHQAEMQHWADRLRESGFATVDALCARPHSPRLYFLLDAPPPIRRGAEQIAVDWPGHITWHPNSRTDPIIPLVKQPVACPSLDELRSGLAIPTQPR
jgi:hypothetical protein